MIPLMKNTLLLLIISLCACSPKHYQMYSLQQINPIQSKELEISYNFWNADGFECKIMNNTNNTAIVHLDKSFFILNNEAFDYYIDNSITKTNAGYRQVGYTYYGYYNSAQNTTTAVNSTSYTVREQRDVLIPAHSYKIIKGFRITSTYYNECKLYKYTTKPQEEKYAETNSPFKFSNVFNYSIDGKDSVVKDNFYVSAITNIPQNKFYQSTKVKDCNMSKYMMLSPYYDSQRFYISYIGENNYSAE